MPRGLMVACLPWILVACADSKSADSTKQDPNGPGDDGGSTAPFGGSDAPTEPREPLETLVENEREPWSVAVDERYVYWTTRSEVRRAPLAGGPATMLAAAQSPRQIVTGDGAVFFTDGPPGTVSRVDREGGEVETIGTGGMGAYANGLAFDDGEVFWAFSGSMLGDGTIASVGADGAMSRALATGLAQPSGVAVDDDFVYFTSVGQSCSAGSGVMGGCIGGGVSKVPRAGGAPIAVDPQGLPTDVVVGERGVYWMTTPGPQIMFAPFAGGGAQLLAKVVGEDAGPIAVDAEAFYFSSTGKGRVMKVSLAGGAPKALVTDLGSVGGIAVDEDWVYVAATTQGKILRVAKDGSAAEPSGPITGPCPMPLGTAAEIAATPRADSNLELLALRLDGKVVATEETYQRVVADVTAIRIVDTSLSNIGYFARDDGKQLLLEPNDVTFKSIDAGEYSAWDCLNEFYGMESLEIHGFDLGGSFVLLTLKGNYDLRQLGALYEMLPGIESAQANQGGGDGPTICAKRSGERFEYVIDRAGGDCPAGCTSHDAHYFESTAAGVINPLDTWKSELGGGQPPEWFGRLCSR